jgi:hypothetical protein
MAMLLAVGSLGGGNATDDMVHGNIKASDTWAFYQAKNVRQTEYRQAADRLELELADPSLNATARTAAQAQLGKYRETITRYDDEPDPRAPGDSLRGEGKKQLAGRRRAATRPCASAPRSRTATSTTPRCSCSSPSSSARWRMSIREIEIEALKLPEDERARLAKRLLASLAGETAPTGDDPIFGIGRAPANCGVPDGAVDHDRYLYQQPHG